MKILIAVPTYETIFPEVFKAIYNLAKPCDCDFDFVRGYDCATARNKIAEIAINNEYDYILMIDNDVLVPGYGLKTLLSDDKDIIFGYYPKRMGIITDSCICKLGERNYTQMHTIEELEGLSSSGQDILQIHGGGLGCALIKTDVFSKIPYPWFSWENYQNGNFLSEDLYFCSQCEKYGINLFADTRVRCQHLMREYK